MLITLCLQTSLQTFLRTSKAPRASTFPLLRKALCLDAMVKPVIRASTPPSPSSAVKDERVENANGLSSASPSLSKVAAHAVFLPDDSSTAPDTQSQGL